MRCKFKLNSITRQLGTVTKMGADGKSVVGDHGRTVQEPGELWTLDMNPVYANNDPTHENSIFWAYSPGGSFKLSTVNAAAVASLELGGEYYIDVTPADNVKFPKDE